MKRTLIWGTGMALTAIGIKNAPDGKLRDGNGLMLVKRGNSGKWVYRYSIHGRRPEMGLGTWPDVTLSDARKSRDVWAAELRQGRDPISVRQSQKEAATAAANQADPTFAELVTVVFEARKATLRGDGTRGRWRSPLDRHIIPNIGRTPISKITARDVQDALSPIWRTKHPTAIKAYQRTHIVFSKAKLMGYDCDPFIVEAAKEFLGVVDHQPEHIAATLWQDIPDLYARLQTGGDIAQCLRFIILTLVRSDAARGASLGEIEGNVWTVPADRVKGARSRVQEFRVPLSAEALSIVAQQSEIHSSLLFTGPRGKPVTSRGMEKHLDGLKETGRPHGFRTSFRTWVQDTHACDYDVAETILDHRIHSAVARSYARSDLLDRRQLVMDAWARFVTGQTTAKVVQLHG
ncbi:integrase arm-type DNA-binding domain-containing protein [Roseovarius aestuarii]|nr:integrase arm-type DNA-binding domain-containing protein [Roseovarius aestuarii]